MKRWLLIAIAAFATAGFTALGVWQVERRAWKLALIERVEQRVHAAPAAAPGPSEWPGLGRENAEYRRVTLSGRFLEDRQTLVRAVTELGEGFWLMAPLQTDRGFTVLVNRGFVPQGWREPGESVAIGAPRGDVSAGAAAARPQSAANGAPAAATGGPRSATNGAVDPAPRAADAREGPVTVTGLLRLSEPNGAFLRSNAPTEHRWYSRDVEAISHAQHLTGTAPYFIDADADNGAGQARNQVPSPPPVAGLTVVHFRNSHLQYAITWFTLALMALALGVRVGRTR
jgi:surfeit locus 1 family protein